MSADKAEKSREALDALQQKLFDASALLRCLGRALEADGHEDAGRAAVAIGQQVSSIAISCDEVPL